MQAAQTPYQKPDNLAGLGRRLSGQLIDALVMWLLFMVTVFAGGIIGIPYDKTLLLAFALAGLYFLFADALPNGQSIGKKLLGMHVIDERSYLNCNLLQSALRNVTSFLSILDWGFIFFGSRKRLGDMFASTIVIRSRQTQA